MPGVEGASNNAVWLMPPNMTQEVAQGMVDRMIATNPELAVFRDELVSSMTAQIKGMVFYTKTDLGDISSGDPDIPIPLGINTRPAELEGVITGNPWLGSNVYATLFMLMLELSSELSKSKIKESEIAAEMIGLSMEMSKDVADLIMKIAENERKQQVAKAIAQIVGGALSLAGAVASFACAAKSVTKMNKVQNDPANFYNKKGAQLPTIQGTAKQHEATTLGQVGSSFASGTQGLGQIATGIVDLVNAGMITEKAKMEAQKSIIEAAMRVVQDRGVSGAIEAYKTADDLIAQILQMLNKIVDEAYKSHGIGVR